MKHVSYTKDSQFDKLNFLPFNRKYKVRQDLIDSMNKFGFIVPVVCIRTKLINGANSLWVLDGQHRLVTAQFLNIPVEIVIIEPVGVETIEDLVHIVAAMNSKTLPWKLDNYADAFNYLNYPEYRKLVKITNSCPYSINTIAALTYGIRRSGHCTNSVKNGTYICNNEENTKLALSYAAELSKHEPLTSRMLLALAQTMTMKSFSKEVFTKKYIKDAKCIKELKLDDYSDIFLSWVK